MKIINKIKAFFRKWDEDVELDLASAEIREGKAFLHTKGDEPVTYFVRANDIEIRLNKDAVISEVDIMTVKKPTKEEAEKEKQKEKEIQKVERKKPSAKTPPLPGPGVGQSDGYDLDRFRKRKLYISVYPEEYEAIQEAMKEYGYKQSDFILACIRTATPGSMQKAHKKIVKSHKELRQERQALIAKQLEELAKNGEQTG